MVGRIRGIVASLLVAALVVIAPDSAAVADAMIVQGASSGLPASAPIENRDIPDNGQLTDEDVERLGGEPEAPVDEPAPDMPEGEFVVPTAEPTAPATTPARHARKVQKTENDGAVLAARAEESEVVSQDTYSTTYETEVGSTIRKESTEPLNFLDSSGDWEEISTEVTQDGKRWTAEDHPLSPSFSDRADSDTAVSLEADGHELSFSLDGSADSSAEVDTSDGETKDTLRFENVRGGIDLEYQVEPGGVKETLILDKAPQAAAKWTWSIDVGDMTPVLAAHDVLELRDAGGVVIMHVPTPVAWDSSGEEGVSEDTLINPTVGLVQAEDGSWEYSIEVDRAWLDASDRVYPVSVDPTFQWGPPHQRSFKSDGNVIMNQSHIGNTRQNNTNVFWRTYTWFDASPAYKKFLGQAQLYAVYAGEGTTNGYYAAVNKGTGDCYNCRGDWLADFYLDGGDAYTSGTGIGTFAVNYFWSNYSAIPVHIQGWESSDYTYKKIATAMYMEYWDYPTIAQTAPANGVTGQSLTPTLSISTTNSSPHSPQQLHSFEVSANADMSSPVWSTGWVQPKQVTVPEGKLLPGVTYYWRAKSIDDHNTWLGQSSQTTSAIRTLTTQFVPPTPPVATATPGNATGLPETIVSLTPTLVVDAVADPDNFPAGAEVKYEFKIATGADGKSGAVFTSGLISAGTDGKVRWTVPEGTLRDGNIYSWVVQPTDGVGKNTAPAWVKRIKVDMRLGSSGPSPFDSTGPVTVNLANGNANLSFSSPLVSTLGGPMGMSFSYNSLASGVSDRGLTGSYYDGRTTLGNVPTAPADYTFTGKTPLMVRTDSAVSFDWQADSPGPALQPDHFMAQWNGFVRVPHASSQWRFGVRHDDGVKLRLNNTTVLDKWTNGTTAVEWSGNQNLSTAEVPIQLDYYDATTGAFVELWADDLADSNGDRAGIVVHDAPHRDAGRLVRVDTDRRRRHSLGASNHRAAGRGADRHQRGCAHLHTHVERRIHAASGGVRRGLARQRGPGRVHRRRRDGLPVRRDRRRGICDVAGGWSEACSADHDLQLRRHGERDRRSAVEGRIDLSPQDLVRVSGCGADGVSDSSAELLSGARRISVPDHLPGPLVGSRSGDEPVLRRWSALDHRRPRQ